MPDTEEGMASAAWLYKPLRSKLGILQLAHEQLYLVLSDGKKVFDAPLSEVEVLGWPSYKIAPNSQVKLKAGGKKHRVCFVAPQNAPEVANADDIVWGSQIATAIRANRARGTWPAGMKTGAKWHERLGDGD